MATSNRIRALNRLPFDFQDGLKVGGVDVTALNQTFTPAGAGLVGFTPVGNLSAGNVQAALAELESEKVGFARLDDTDGSSLVGYDGGTVQDVLDSAKPMADYTALRVYTGRATSVRITSNGLTGFFYRDDADTTSADNGGTIIVSGNGKRWRRVYSGAVNVKWFGAKGDWNGTTGADDTAAFQAAYNSLANSRIGARGLGRIYIPRGRYLMNGTASMSSVLSLIVEGDGPEATQIVRTSATGDLFYVSTYVYFEFCNIKISHEPSVGRSEWTSNCFQMLGNGGGRKFKLRRVTTSNFNRIVSFSGSAGNEDTNNFEECTFIDFKTFLYCRNSQAVINKITQCTWYGYVDMVFDIGGFAYTHIDTSNAVQGGTFIYLAASNSGAASQFTLTNVKLEFWNNITANNVLGTTKIIEVEDTASATAHITMNGCGIAGGTPDPSIYQFDMLGGANFTLDVDRGQYSQCKVRTKGNYVESFNNYWIRFKNLSSAPSTTIQRISRTSGASAQPPVIFENCSGVSNIILRGPGNSFLNAKAAGFGDNTNRNAVTGPGGYLLNSFVLNGKSVHSIPFYGELQLIEKIRFFIQISGSGSPTIELKAFKDESKTIQIGSTITVSSYASPAVYDVAVPGNTFSSDGVYLTIENTVGANATIFGMAYVDTLSV